MILQCDIAPEGAMSEILMLIERDTFVPVFAEWKYTLHQSIDERSD
jgi:hypothetical protein